MPVKVIIIEVRFSFEDLGSSKNQIAYFDFCFGNKTSKLSFSYFMARIFCATSVNLTATKLGNSIALCCGGGRGFLQN